MSLSKEEGRKAYSGWKTKVGVAICFYICFTFLSKRGAWHVMRLRQIRIKKLNIKFNISVLGMWSITYSGHCNQLIYNTKNNSLFFTLIILYYVLYDAPSPYHHLPLYPILYLINFISLLLLFSPPPIILLAHSYLL